MPELRIKDKKGINGFVAIAPAYLRSLGWKKGDEISMRIKDSSLVLEKV